MIENFVWNFLFYFKILQFAEKGENYKKNGCMLLLLNTFLGYFYGLSNDLNDMAYLMLKEASFLYLDKYLIQFDESV